MQVARASGALPTSSLGVKNPSSASYAPLYLSTTLRDIAFDIEELEAIALDRLKVLKSADSARSLSKQVHTAASRDAVRVAVRAAERTVGLNIPPVGNVGREDRVLKDEASHFLLRLALCKTHEHRSWLLAAECDLFAARLEGAGAEFALSAIEKADGPKVRLAPQRDLERFHAELDAVARGSRRERGDAGTRYYTIAFEEVPSLVRRRQVFLHAGVAYVPEKNVLDVVAAQFRSKLSLALVTASKAVAHADSDQRMRPILESIRQHFAMDEDSRKGFDVAQGIEKISLGQLEDSIPAMPLCMANMMKRLREQHHLRYSARLQLGLFLKGCGLSLDESLRYWRTEFGKGAINSEKFEKSYAYNIRHHYGKEGKRKNMTPFECMRIINDRPGPGEHNGCPYREFEEGRLRQALKDVGTDPNAIAAIAATAKEGNLQLACGMCFASSQPGAHGVSDHGLSAYIPSHPNEYFIEARRRRFAPEPKEQMLDEDIGDEEMLVAAEALESQNSTEATPKSGVIGEALPEQDIDSAAVDAGVDQLHGEKGKTFPGPPALVGSRTDANSKSGPETAPGTHCESQKRAPLESPAVAGGKVPEDRQPPVCPQPHSDLAPENAEPSARKRMKTTPTGT